MYPKKLSAFRCIQTYAHGVDSEQTWRTPKRKAPFDTGLRRGLNTRESSKPTLALLKSTCKQLAGKQLSVCLLFFGHTNTQQA
jgi:hypothetical protein